MRVAPTRRLLRSAVLALGLWFVVVLTVFRSDQTTYSPPYSLSSLARDALSCESPVRAMPRRPPFHNYFHSYPDSNRHVPGGTWRPPPDQLGPQLYTKDTKARRTAFQHELKMNSDAVLLDNVFLLVKTGSATLWQRMPGHLYATLPFFNNFGLYSDAPDSIGGYEVIDAIDLCPRSLVMQSPHMQAYRTIQDLRTLHLYLDPKPAMRIVDANDGWTLDRFKTLPMLRHAYENAPRDMDWFVMIDDDTFLFARNLHEFLKMLNPAHGLYTGSAVAGLEHIFAYGGSGVVISRALMDAAFGSGRGQVVDEYIVKADHECCGDYMIAKFLAETLDTAMDYDASGNRFQGESITGIGFSFRNWCQPIMTVHHQNSRDLELLWQYVKLAGDRPVLHRDIYLDFVKPYLARGPRKSWDNGANEHEYSWIADRLKHPDSHFDYSTRPYASAEACQKQCADTPSCLMYRYDPFRLYCGTSSSVSLGEPVIPKIHENPTTGFHNENRQQKLQSLKTEIDYTRHELGLEGMDRDFATDSVVSEWLVDRIVELRRNQPCDPLATDPGAEGGPHAVFDQSEGWWLRAKTRFPERSVQ